jgi:hypothetical protein
MGIAEVHLAMPIWYDGKPVIAGNRKKRGSVDAELELR